MRFIPLIMSVLAVFATPIPAAETETAIFAGGCFWSVESDFDYVPGVTGTLSGFTGGQVEQPTYRQVAYGGTGHKEAVEVSFDPSVVSYGKLLDVYWHSVDPTDADGQFCDRGESYQTAIFVNNEEQRRLAEASKAAAEKELGQTIVTPILDAGSFWPAEEYHQNYHQSQERTLTRLGYLTKADAYKRYREACGRDARVRAVWGDSAHRGIEKNH